MKGAHRGKRPDERNHYGPGDPMTPDARARLSEAHRLFAQVLSDKGDDKADHRRRIRLPRPVRE